MNVVMDMVSSIDTKQAEASYSLPDKASFYIVLFTVASMCGWVYETVDNVFTFGGIYLREMFLLPWCPIYGVGALLLLAVMTPVAERLRERGCSTAAVFIAMFVTAYAVTLVVELSASYICELATGSVPWDYSESWLNFDGRVAPWYTARFALAGLLAFYVLAPLLRRAMMRYPQQMRICAFVALVLMTADLSGEVLGLWDGLQDKLVPYGIKHW